MGFPEDKVYEYIMKNLKDFKNIRVASLADSLTCLTDADRDELHSREETRGSHATVYRFYQHLRCRQGWVLDLIDALHYNNAGHLADELQRVYNSWRTRPTTPAAASFPPVGHGSRPTVSSTGVQTPSPGPSTAPGTLSAEQPRQDLPTSDHPPLSSASTTMSTGLDSRAPVQELLPKTLLQEDSPQPPPPASKVQDRASDGQEGEGLFSQSMEATQVTPGTARATSGAERGRDWLSLHQHPVCVDNGCFGNSNHLQRGAPDLALPRSLLKRDVNAAHKNEPEENFYLSTESAPKLEEAICRRELQPPDSAQTNQAESSSQQVDLEQKQVRMLQEHGKSGDTQMETTTLVAATTPRDTSSSCDTSLKPPVQEEKLPAVDMTSSTCSVPVEEKVALVDPLSPVVGSSEGTAGRKSFRESSATIIWVSGNDMERDVELSKPGVLFSTVGEGPEVASRCLGSQGPHGPHPWVSNSFTHGSDRLMISTDSSSSGEALSRVYSGCPAPMTHEDPMADEATGASRDSHPPLSAESSTLGTQLEASNNLQDGANHLGNLSALDSSIMTKSSQARVPSGDSSGSSLPYILSAIALLSMGFLFFTRRQK
ncbi:MAVS protein, partial [Rhinopomastus cyanomelas]|nr:MAVS protein [Rhinopomastus cyanomelas]